MLHSRKHVKGSRKGQRANSKLQRGALSIQSIEQWPVAFASQPSAERPYADG